jgi:hypothetical protein
MFRYKQDGKLYRISDYRNRTYVFIGAENDNKYSQIHCASSSVPILFEDVEPELKNCDCPGCSGETEPYSFANEISNVIYNGEVTIVIWADGVKTVVRPSAGDEFDPEMGLAIAIAQEMFGSRSQFVKFVNKYVKISAEREAKKK